MLALARISISSEKKLGIEIPERLIIIAMCMGGNVRTGLEDTIYYRKGELAQGNAQLVIRIVRIANEIGIKK